MIILSKIDEKRYENQISIMKLVKSNREWLSKTNYDMQQFDSKFSELTSIFREVITAEDEEIEETISKKLKEMAKDYLASIHPYRRFSSLHNHTNRSLLDAIGTPEQIVQQAYELGFNAVALTEHGNMFSMIDGYKKAKELGIKYIFGCEIYECDDMYDKRPEVLYDRYHLILLAKNKTGVENLFKIVTAGQTDGFYGKPRVDRRFLAEHSEGLVCLSACLASRISRLLVNDRCPCCHDKPEEGGDCVSFEPDWEQAKKEVEIYKSIFGDDFYIELQNHRSDAQHRSNKRNLKLALETNTEFTITFDSHMLNESQMKMHSTFVKMGQDREAGETYLDCWQTDIDGIHAIMDAQIGREYVLQAIATSDKISAEVNFEYELHQDLMPHVKIPSTFKDDRQYLKHLINEGCKKRGIDKLPADIRKVCYDRLRYEFEVLDYLDYCSYFIMLNQLVTKLREREVPLGYSRGSGGNSYTLYVIGVTEVDSIKWDLDFSRFGNKGRKGSPADYDMDVSQLRRGEAIEVAAELFGEENICQLATFNSLTPKVAFKDLAKVFHAEGVYNIPYKKAEAISKLIPDDPSKKIPIAEALEISPQLAAYKEQYPLIFEYIEQLQYAPKSVGCHAAAVIIAPRPVVEFAPLMYNEKGNIMMQLEMGNAMDDIGLVKMDFLGLVTVDVVDYTLKFAGLTWKDIDLATMDLDDKAVFSEIYGKGRTLGIFQMESKVAQEMFRNMQPDNINDIFAVNALNRPAILNVGMDKIYIQNKHDKNKIRYAHPDLEEPFAPTYGVMLYQEQALKVFSIAGFPEDETDQARRAIGKKKPKVMAKLYAQFKSGLAKRNWTEEAVKEIWDLIKAQADYSFNKGHSTAYGLLSYVTAWLKYYYPVEFMCALLISEIGNYEQITKYIDECKKMEIPVLPPDINKSERHFSIVDGKILFGLEAIKGVGAKATDLILFVRESIGRFDNLEHFYHIMEGINDDINFLQRFNSRNAPLEAISAELEEGIQKIKKIDSGTMIALIKSGAFGSNIDEILMEFAHLQFPKRQYKPVVGLPTKKVCFETGLATSEEEWKKHKDVILARYNARREEAFIAEQNERLAKHLEEFESKYMATPEMYEFQTLSIFLSGSPFDHVMERFKDFDLVDDGEPITIAGTIATLQRKKSKKKDGKQYARLSILTVKNGVIEGICFNKQYVMYQDLLVKGNNVVILAEKDGDGFKVNKMKSYDVWKAEKGIK